MLSALKESIQCVALGIRDGARPPISLISGAIWVVSIAFWYLIFRYYAPLTLEWHGWGKIAESAVHFLALGLLYGVSVFVSVRIAIELVLMKRIQKACLLHYPEISRTHKNSLVQNLSDIVKSWIYLMVGWAVCLLIPFAGPVLLFVFFGYMNLRSLMNDALEGIASDAEKKAVIREQKLVMTLIGTSVSILILLPLVGLVAPSILGASACHFAMRSLRKSRMGAISSAI